MVSPELPSPELPGPTSEAPGRSSRPVCTIPGRGRAARGPSRVASSGGPAVFHVEDEVGLEKGPPPALVRWAIPTFVVLFVMNLLDDMDR